MDGDTLTAMVFRARGHLFYPPLVKLRAISFAHNNEWYYPPKVQDAREDKKLSGSSLACATKGLARLVDRAAHMSAEGRLSAAEKLLRSTLEGARKLFGANDERSLHIATELAMLIHQRDSARQGESSIKKFHVSKRGSIHVEIDHSAEETVSAPVETDASSSSEAETLLRQIATQAKETYGANSKIYVCAIGNLASVLFDVDKFEEALPLMYQDLLLLEKTRGKNDVDTLVATNNFATCLQELGRLEEAAAYMKTAAAGFKGILSDSHETTLRVKENLRALLREIESGEDAE